MKISVNWLKSLLPLNHSVEEIEHKLSVSGLEVEHVEDWFSTGTGLQGFVIGEVLTCTKHPNADKLSVTTVNIGEAEPKQIVCGAPNVAANQKVIVATVGTTILMPGKEAFTIQKAKIRGEASEGMICAEDECGLGNSHDGILVLPADAPVGMPASQYFNIQQDTTLEIGLTANRGDACSHLGVASDVAALFNIPFQRFPKTNLPQTPPTSKSIHIAQSELCERYLALELHNVQVQPSPETIQHHLKAIGIEPKNNVVDASNYTLQQNGHPNHIFDLDTITGNIQVRLAHEGETLTLLDGKTINLHNQDIVIADDSGAIALAGVMGGQKTAVTPNTRNVLVEIAHFHPTHIRKSAKRHLYHTDASFRFERGIDKHHIPHSAQTIIQLLQENAQATLIGISDEYPVPHQPKTVTFLYSKFLQFTGAMVEKTTATDILHHLGFETQWDSQNNDILHVTIPSWKNDCEKAVDIYEEILRIHGYDQIPMSGKMQASLGAFEGMSIRKAENKIREFLISNGLMESATNSLHPAAWYPNNNHIVQLTNPLSTDMDTLRASIIPGLLQSVSHNIKRRAQRVQLFEMGSVYSLNSPELQKNKALLNASIQTTNFVETPTLAMVFWGDHLAESWENPSKTVHHYNIKQILQGLLIRLGSKLDINQIAIQQAPKNWLKAAEIDTPVFFVEIPWRTLLNPQAQNLKVQSPSKFPGMRRDLSLVVNQNTTYKELRSIANKLNLPYLQDIRAFDVFQGKPLEANQKAIALSFHFSNPNATLVDEEIEAGMNKLIAAYEAAGANIRK